MIKKSRFKDDSYPGAGDGDGTPLNADTFNGILVRIEHLEAAIVVEGFILAGLLVLLYWSW